MDREQKVSRLLTQVDTDKVVAKLRQAHPEAVMQHEGLLVWEEEDT